MPSSSGPRLWRTRGGATGTRWPFTCEDEVRSRGRCGHSYPRSCSGSTVKVSKFATEQLKIEVATFVARAMMIERKPKGQAVREATKEFRKTDRSILRYLAEGEKWADRIAAALDEPRDIERADIKYMMWQAHRGDKTMLYDMMRTPEHHGSPGDI
jgi:hypothetical protein